MVVLVLVLVLVLLVLVLVLVLLVLVLVLSQPSCRIQPGVSRRPSELYIKHFRGHPTSDRDRPRKVSFHLRLLGQCGPAELFAPWTRSTRHAKLETRLCVP